MTNIATNLRIALLSTINQSQSFDLDALFLNFAFSDQVYFSRPDATTNTDPFLFTLPYFSNQTLTLTIEENLNGFAGLMTLRVNSIMEIITTELLMSYLVIQGWCSTRIMTQKSQFMRILCLISFDQPPRWGQMITRLR